MTAKEAATSTTILESAHNIDGKGKTTHGTRFGEAQNKKENS